MIKIRAQSAMVEKKGKGKFVFDAHDLYWTGFTTESKFNYQKVWRTDIEKKG